MWKRAVLTVMWAGVVPCLAAAPNSADMGSPDAVAVSGADIEGVTPQFRSELPLPDLSRLATDAEGSSLEGGLRLPSAFALATSAALAGRPMAFEYSDGYRLRAKIHRYASYAMLPLFVTQFAVGQKLYNGNGSDATRSLHGALATGTGVLFGVNSVTGVWNLYEGRQDPNHRTRRIVHGVLMLVADAGFVATGATAPDDEGEGGVSRSTHRTIALTSMGVATVGYLVMLLSH
jgi:hypothetical protein